MKVQSKKDSFFIHTKRKPTNVIKVSNYYDSKRNYSAEWEFVIIKNGLISDVDDNYYDSSLPIISFEEWQILPDFPKPEYEPKDVAFNQRKVIGYKLIKPEYKEAVREIIKSNKNHISGWWWTNFDENINKGKGFNFSFVNEDTECNSINHILKNAGVLNLWFEEVYKDTSITLKSGVKLSEDDIAEVKEILNNK